MKQVARFSIRRLFPLKHWNQVDPTLVRTHIEAAMEQWGMPATMRFDNGRPWGTSSPTPSAMALWLIGLGINVVFGRPARSTDNAVVERSHGILNKWVVPKSCGNFDQLQTRLAYFTQLQRERYPFAQASSRLACFPQLKTCPWKYTTNTPDLYWSDQNIFDHLATFRFQRKIEVNGRFTLLGGEYSLNRAYQRRYLSVGCDPITHEWVVYEDDGQEIARFVPTNLSYNHLITMRLYEPHT